MPMEILTFLPKFLIQFVVILTLLIWQTVVFIAGFFIYFLFQKMLKIKKRIFIPLCFLPPLLLIIVMPISLDSLLEIIRFGFSMNIQFWKNVIHGSGIVTGFNLVWKSGFMILFSTPISGILSLIDLIPNSPQRR